MGIATFTKAVKDLRYTELLVLEQSLKTLKEESLRPTIIAIHRAFIEVYGIDNPNSIESAVRLNFGGALLDIKIATVPGEKNMHDYYLEVGRDANGSMVMLKAMSNGEVLLEFESRVKEAIALLNG